ncbi:MAG: hypothetical protein ACYDBJ_14640 [Aggregatilineales bacterium]
MANIDVMDYDMMGQMIKALDGNATQLEDTARAISALAETVESTALLGKAGTALVGVLRDQMIPAILRLSTKYGEVRDSVTFALQTQQADDQQEAGQFTGRGN